MTLEALKKIKWKQPKYVLPIIVYFSLLLLGYLFIDLFQTDTADIPDKNLTTTEYLNPDLPDAKMKGDGIGNKYESMVKSYGKIDDYSAMESIDRNDEDDKESYDSKYSDEERQLLESQEAEKLAEIQKQLEASAQKGEEIGQGNSLNDAQQREQDAYAELEKALAQARLQGQMAANAHPADETDENAHHSIEGTINVNDRAVKGVSDDDEVQEVVKKKTETSDFFNTLTENDPEPNLIKAIIDEDIKAVDGSRVRLRLLDDIEINEIVVPKGTYLYAQMSGFGSQRVKGSIKSILINDDIIRVSLQLYDTDGLEGLYVPSSNFRETSKDVASGAMSNTSSLTNGASNSGNSIIQWRNQAITNAVQKTSNAVSKAIKKNSAKLKYGSYVYLVNGKEKKK